MPHPITVRHLVAGTLGNALLRAWYHDGQVNATRFAESGEVLAGRPDELLDLVLDPAERNLLSGETFDVDTGAPVGPYPHQYPCTATIESVTSERLSTRTRSGSERFGVAVDGDDLAADLRGEG